jgi:hypothetical protein
VGGSAEDGSREQVERAGQLDFPTSWAMNRPSAKAMVGVTRR